MTTPITVQAAAADSPNYLCTAYQEMAPGWERNRDVRNLPDLLRTRPISSGATSSVALVNRQTCETYLPRFEAEETDDYTVRVALTHPYDALEQTIQALVGLIFRTDPEPSPDAKPQLLVWLDNFDGAGRDASAVLQEATEAALTDGHAALLVEYPSLPEPPSAAKVEAEGIQPWVTVIKADQILNWITDTRYGREYLRQVTILDYSEQPDGAFGTKCVKRYRVYKLEFRDGLGGFSKPVVLWELWQEQPSGPPTKIKGGELRGPKEIPLYPIYGGVQTDLLESKPPLDGLAFSNIDHTQVKSDRRYSLHKCAIPVPIFINRLRQQAAVPGAAGGEIVISSSRGIDIGVGGDAKYMEPAGNALEQLRLELEDIERRMGQQGLGLLRADSAPQTATFNVMQFGQQKSKLGRCISSLSRASNAAIVTMGLYANVPEPGTIAFRRDLTRFGLSDQQLELISRLEERGQLTLPTLLRVLKQEALLPEDLDLEQEAEDVKTATSLEPPPPDPAAIAAAAAAAGQGDQGAGA